MVNLAADSWTKYCDFNLKSRKNSCPKKVVIIFCRNFAGEFWKVSRSQAYIPISRWCYGEHFLRKFIWKPQFCSERWSSRAQSIVLFSFAAKSTLRIKIQCWFFLWRYMNASPFEISKKIAKIYFYFWLISFCLQKTEWSFKAKHEQ